MEQQNIQGVIRKNNNASYNPPKTTQSQTQWERDGKVTFSWGSSLPARANKSVDFPDEGGPSNNVILPPQKLKQDYSINNNFIILVNVRMQSMSLNIYIMEYNYSARKNGLQVSNARD
jgi:hypothetical protein